MSELNKADLAHAKNLFMTEVLQRLSRLPCVSFAVIHGPAVGGGAELVTACDFRIMAEDQNDAYIQFVHAKMGLTPGTPLFIILITFARMGRSRKTHADRRQEVSSLAAHQLCSYSMQ